MIGVFKLGVVIAVLGLLPQQALGQCAWVLWDETTLTEGGRDPGEARTTWSTYLLSGSPNFSQCERNRIMQAKELLHITDAERRGRDILSVTKEEKAGFITSKTTFKNGSTLTFTHWLKCLPD